MHQSLRLLGIGGIGIIRMSGKECFTVLDRIFVPKKPQPLEEIKGYSMKYGVIQEKEQVIDEVLVSYFKEPRSYTTENMCEINSHGGNVVVRKILELCLQNGAELAEPGEFTKRAFLNGRIDLLQAESVIDVIHAKSEREAKTSVKQLEGALSKKIHEIKQEIMDVMVNLEVVIDYPEYDVEEVTKTQISSMLESVEQKLKRLEKSFDEGKIIREGIKTAIIGRPNAGKSSLLNAILQEDRAIVTEYEGTTRDTIEEFVTIAGIPIKLIDTAGIHEAKDEVEKIGIEKAKEIAEEADLVIAIFDSTKELSQEDRQILTMIQAKPSIILLNKADLPAKIDENLPELKQASSNMIKISALHQWGLDQLYQKIEELFHLDEINLDQDVVITNLRQKNLISKAIQEVNQTKQTLEQNMPIDITSIFMKEILEDLAKITGEFVTEDIIQEIFSQFCLGK